jgi:hypothetical protein
MQFLALMGDSGTHTTQAILMAVLAVDAGILPPFAWPKRPEKERAGLT